MQWVMRAIKMQWVMRAIKKNAFLTTKEKNRQRIFYLLDTLSDRTPIENKYNWVGGQQCTKGNHQQKQENNN